MNRFVGKSRDSEEFLEFCDHTVAPVITTAFTVVRRCAQITIVAVRRDTYVAVCTDKSRTDKNRTDKNRRNPAMGSSGKSFHNAPSIAAR